MAAGGAQRPRSGPDGPHLGRGGLVFPAVRTADGGKVDGADLPDPEYHTVKEGPAHEPVFRSTVVIDGAKYDSLPGIFTRKAAEQSAAEAALMEIVESIPTTQRIPVAQKTGLWRSLLQEYAQEMNYSIPSYT